MAELCLANDPSVALQEKRCFKFGAERHDGAKHVEASALLYTDGNSAAPLEVCSFFYMSVLHGSVLLTCRLFMRALDRS